MSFSSISPRNAKRFPVAAWPATGSRSAALWVAPAVGGGVFAADQALKGFGRSTCLESGDSVSIIPGLAVPYLGAQLQYSLRAGPHVRRRAPGGGPRRPHRSALVGPARCPGGNAVPWSALGCPVVFAGGASNALDRVAHGCVTDCLCFAGTLTFNIADVAILFGLLLLAGSGRGVPAERRPIVWRRRVLVPAEVLHFGPVPAPLASLRAAARS